MARRVIRNLDDAVKATLQAHAARGGRSVEEAVHAGEPLGTRIARRFAGLGMADDIPELRGQSVRAPDLGG